MPSVEDLLGLRTDKEAKEVVRETSQFWERVKNSHMQYRSTEIKCFTYTKVMQ
jgi:hypothetical protein